MVSLGSVSRRLWILLWKNLILRKRQYIVTALEIILPTFLVMLIALVRSQVPSSRPRPSPPSWYTDDNRESSGSMSEEGMIQSARNELTSYSESGVIFAYVPETSRTLDFVEKFGRNLTDNSDRDFSSSSSKSRSIEWRGFPNEGELEDFAAQYGLGDDKNRPKLSGALVFQGLDFDNPQDYPRNHKISYKIRLVKPFSDTKEIMPRSGTRVRNPDEENNYISSGFSGAQIIIDKMLSEMLTGNTPTYKLSTQKFPGLSSKDVEVDLQIKVFCIALPYFFVHGFIFLVPSIVRGIVSEKETGIKELMKMTGLPNWMHWVGWMMNSLIVLIISITIVIFLLFVTFDSKGGAVVKHGDPTLWWFVLLVYIIWATSYCFLVSSLFERPTLATTAGIVIWFVTYYGVSGPLEPGYINLSLSSKLFICLCPNMALHYALKVMCAFEAKGIGAQWGNIGDPVNASDSLTLGYVLLMFIVSIVLYIMLAMYFEQIIPTKYGVRKPWYYIFMPSEWGFRKQMPSEDISDFRKSAIEAEESDQFEKIPGEFKIGMEVLKLRKEFAQRKVAVDDVSLKAYEGQIFCLLGHNGAGKTTTMSILTGLMGPTSGTALINGRDIRTNMNEIRQELGLCPQDNLLFAKLTVAEHLKFFGMVKGLTSSQAEAEIPYLIWKLQLGEKANELSSSLSGGQKRKLSLGCAIIGGSKVLFLDECSSGLDPEARRVIWDLLLEIRGQRTIILTTHFLEEADVLGDRIAIMASGKVQCCGSPMFLKKFYGTGYSLSLTLNPGGSPDQVLETIQFHIPSASIKSHSDRGESSELSITLPTENNNTSNFPNMFADLLAKKTELQIEDVGIQTVSMEEVFLKVEELSHAGSSAQSLNCNLNRIRSLRTSGLRLLAHQFWGLLLKKVIYSLKRWKFSLAQMIVPVGLLIFAILISNRSYNTNDKMPPLTMSLSSYTGLHTLYSTSKEDVKLGPIFDGIVGSSAERLPDGSDVSAELLRIRNAEIELYRERYIVAAEFRKPTVTAMYSTIPGHSCPLAINLITNTMLRSLDDNDKGFSIEVTNHPLASGQQSYVVDTQSNSMTPVVVGVLLSIGLALLAASFIVLPIEERLCQSKQLQMMTGVNPLIYWGSSFLWDYFVMLICVCIMTACLPIFERYGSFTSHGGAGVVFLILAVYGIGAISFSYLFSLVAKSPGGGFSLVTIIHIMTGTIFSIVVYFLEPEYILIDTVSIIGWIGRLFPTYGVSKAAMIYAKISSGNVKCNAFTDAARKAFCQPVLDLSNKEGLVNIQSCCANCKKLGVNCFQPEAYLLWSRNHDSFSTPGIGQEIFFMLLMSLIYLIILLIVELGCIKKLMNEVLQQDAAAFNTNSDDTDVQTETERVKELFQTGRTSEDAVIVANLSKSFGTFSAVSKLTFGVHHGECFGLLGVNGAGKTTSFRMLTGDEIISTGDAFMDRYSLQSDRKKFLSNIGYCPQFDGIIGVLSGKQMLELFARLRGIDSSAITFESQKWLSLMGLTESGTVQCQKYSGGMKRRLSAAMAMIGDPPVVFLDEPTSGVDAVSRRQFWNIISSLREAGQAIILTSHSMEECEFLCSRLGIMVNGELQCLGGVQHLKNKFAQGYSLTIRLKSEALQNQEGIAAMANEVLRQFYPCSFKDQHQNIMQFHIETTSMQWDVLFKTMENIKSQYEAIIEEYSVSQTSLEEVFLSFARKQYNNQRQVNASACRRLLCGGCCC